MARGQKNMAENQIIKMIKSAQAFTGACAYKRGE